jgi:hypothetical protein
MGGVMTPEAEALIRNTRTAALECRLVAIADRASRGLPRAGDAEVAALAETILAERAAPRRKVERPKRDVRICTAWRPIIDDVCSRHRLSYDELITATKADRIVKCRHEIWHSLNKVRGVALAEIGRRFGGYDHSSVLHGVRMHEARAAAYTH